MSDYNPTTPETEPQDKTPPEQHSSVSAQDFSATPRVSTKKEFALLPENSELFKRIKECAIFCYICAAITLVVGIAMGNLFGIVDVLILVGLGLAIHLTQNKVCAILLACYAALNTIMSIAEDGKIRGWLIILAAVYACSATFKLDKAWKKYQEQ